MQSVKEPAAPSPSPAAAKVQNVPTTVVVVPATAAPVCGWPALLMVHWGMLMPAQLLSAGSGPDPDRPILPLPTMQATPKPVTVVVPVPTPTPTVAPSAAATAQASRFSGGGLSYLDA